MSTTRNSDAVTLSYQHHDVRRLRTFTTFDNFPDAELLLLVQAAHHDSRSTPWPLIYQQSPSDACYILLSGEAGVYVGRDLIATLEPGEVIGESTLRRGKLRSATVTTMGPAEFLRIERDDLEHLLRESPALRDAMEAAAIRHAPVAVKPAVAQPKPERSVLSALVPTELLNRFEQTARCAGVPFAAAIEDALTRWVELNSVEGELSG